jgi:hypothetical protein
MRGGLTIFAVRSKSTLKPATAKSRETKSNNDHISIQACIQERCSFSSSQSAREIRFLSRRRRAVGVKNSTIISPHAFAVSRRDAPEA